MRVRITPSIAVAAMIGVMASVLAIANSSPAGAAVGDRPEIVVQHDGVNHWYLNAGTRNWIPKWCADQHKAAGVTVRTAAYSEFAGLPSVNNGCPSVGTIPSSGSGGGSSNPTPTTVAPTTTSSGGGSTSSGNGELVVQPNGNHWYLVNGTKNWVNATCGQTHRNAGYNIRTALYSEFGSRPNGGQGCPSTGTLGGSGGGTVVTVPAGSAGSTTGGSGGSTTSSIGTFSTFLNGVYQGILKRSPDASGASYFGDRLESQTSNSACRSAMVQTVRDVMNSAEAHSFRYSSGRQQVEGFYLALLGRTADSAGATYWTGIYNSSGRDGVVDGLAASSEFANRANSMCPSGGTSGGTTSGGTAGGGTGTSGTAGGGETNTPVTPEAFWWNATISASYDNGRVSARAQVNSNYSGFDITIRANGLGAKSFSDIGRYSPVIYSWATTTPATHQVCVIVEYQTSYLGQECTSVTVAARPIFPPTATGTKWNNTAPHELYAPQGDMRLRRCTNGQKLALSSPVAISHVFVNRVSVNLTIITITPDVSGWTPNTTDLIKYDHALNYYTAKVSRLECHNGWWWVGDYYAQPMHKTGYLATVLGVSGNRYAALKAGWMKSNGSGLYTPFGPR